jgi:hypothetical protein
MKILGSVIMFFLFSVSIFAQSSANATANVSASLKHGLSITNVGGDIDFGEIILTGSAQNPSITPGSGTSFLVTGQPNSSVTVTFADVTLDNNAWVTTNGGTNGTMTFTSAMEETGTSSTYTGANAITSGSSQTLTNVSGLGTLYLWLDGSLSIAANQPNGDYTGTFTVTVAY